MWGKKYSYSLSYTHATLKLATILPEPCHNLMMREAVTFAGVSRKFTTTKWNDNQHMSKNQVHVENNEGQKRRS